MSDRPVRVAILASGAGSNAERLMRAVRLRPDMEVAFVGCNRPQAGVLARAEALGVPCVAITKTGLDDGTLLHTLRRAEVDFIALAGFLLKVPEAVVEAFSGRMLNLHPALLPAFGGKGMYGRYVHEAVYAAMQRGEVHETGITLHWVTAEFDEGAPFFQARAALDPLTDTADTIAHKIAALEAAHYATQTLRAIAGALSLSETPFN